MQIDVRRIVINAATWQVDAIVLARSRRRRRPSRTSHRSDTEVTRPTTLRIRVSLRANPDDTLTLLRDRVRLEALLYLDPE